MAIFNKAVAISFGVIAEEKLPISLAWMSGVFTQLNINHDVIDFNYELQTQMQHETYAVLRHNMLRTPTKEVENVLDSCVDRIVHGDYDFVAASMFSYRQYPVAKEFLIRLRKKLPSIVISVGGPGVWHIPAGNVTTNGRELFREGLVDMYTLGNAETVFPLYLMGSDPLSLQGVNTTDDCEEQWTEVIGRIQDRYIAPNYRKIPIQNASNDKKEILVTGANGCPGRCAFCSIREYIPFPSYRNGVDVADECYSIYKQTGVTRFRRTDGLANGHTKHFRAFNERIIELKKQDPLFNFIYNAMFLPKSPHIQDDAYYRIMAEAGCSSLDLGIESGSERLRIQMRKPYTDEELDWHFAMCHKYGIKNNISIFVGFPTETEEDFQQNLRMLERYQKYVADGTFNEIQHCGKFVLYTKTYIYNNLDEFDVEVVDESSDPIQWICKTNRANTIEERLNRERIFLQKARELGYRIDVYDSADKPA